MKRGDGITRLSDGQLCEYKGELLDGRKVFKCIEDGVAYTVLREGEYSVGSGVLPVHVSIGCNRDGSDPIRFIMVPCPVWDDIGGPPITDKKDIRLMYQDPLDVFYKGSDVNRFFGNGITMPDNPQWP